MRIAPVYDLIKTLSSAEVKMLRKRSESPKAAFIGLLEIMLVAQKNDDFFLKTDFSKKFPNIDYAETKSYLYSFMLRHLTEFNHKQNSFTEINYRLVTAETLVTRGMSKEAYNIFSQVKETANRENFFQLSVVAIKRMKALKLKSSKTENDYRQLHILHREESEAIEKDKEGSMCLLLYGNFIQLLEKYGGVINEKTKREFEKIVATPLIQNRSALHSRIAQLIAFDLITNYYLITNQEQLFLRENKLELRKYTPTLLIDPYYAYRNIFMLHNLARKSPYVTPTELKKYRTLLAKAPTPNQNTVNFKRLFLLYVKLQATKDTNHPDFNTLLEEVKTELNLEWLSEKPKEKMGLLFQILQTLTEHEKYLLAADFIVPAIHDKTFEGMLPAQFIGLRLFYLLVLYEQRKFADMEPALRALKYALRTKQLENPVSIELLNFFTALMRNTSTTKKQKILSKIQNRLQAMPYFNYQQLGINTFLESAWWQKTQKKLIITSEMAL